MPTKRQDQPAIYGTGLIALDLVVNESSDKPSRISAGGTCGNVLAILAYLGWRAFPVARLSRDSAGHKVLADLKRWGVQLDFATCAPKAATPIIIETISRDKNGVATHRFNWRCPHCGRWLPSYRPVTERGVADVVSKMARPRVFFMDRLSRAALTLAERARELGALIVFEPSATQDKAHVTEALQIVNILKYSEHRFVPLDDNQFSNSSVQLEIQTCGEAGLRYRSRLPKARSTGWKALPAMPAPVLVDSCGAGDWLTAGLLSKIGGRGAARFTALDGAALSEALRFGQALAAWTCGYEGARGGMYQVTHRDLMRQVAKILQGEKPAERAATRDRLKLRASSVECPACP